MIAVDTLFQGLSGLILFILIAWACVRIIGGRR